MTGAKTQEVLTTSVKGGYVLVVLACLSDHLSVSKITYKVMNRFACMNLLSEVYLRSINDILNFGDHADYDPDTGSGL